MDANKLKKLKEINFTIKRVCGNCKFYEGAKNWGCCNIAQYSHLKHTQSIRNLSVHYSGNCGNHEWEDKVDLKIHGFAELKEK